MYMVTRNLVDVGGCHIAFSSIDSKVMVHTIGTMTGRKVGAMHRFSQDEEFDCDYGLWGIDRVLFYLKTLDIKLRLQTFSLIIVFNV
jgi:hypothetical protein